MATKKNGKKDDTLDACIGEIDELMGELRKLTGNSKAFRAVSVEWTKAKARVRKSKDGKGKSVDLNPRKLPKELLAGSLHGGGRKVKQAVGREVANALVKANDRTVKKPAKAADKVPPKADAAEPKQPIAPQVVKEPPLPASVRISDNELELHLGSFGAKPLAEHDAGEFIGHPMVFWYRRGMFPDPRQSRVNPTVIEAKVVERKGKAFRAAPFTVHVKIGMAGDAAHCRSWAKGVLARNKGEQE